MSIKRFRIGRLIVISSKVAVYNNLGVINNKLGRYDKSLHYYSLAEKLIDN
jgi:hypothetical protein